MMPPGRRFAKQDTAKGLRTGVFLVDAIAKILPDTPIVVLTNVANAMTHDELKAKRNVKAVLPKPDNPPFAVVEMIEKIIGG